MSKASAKSTNYLIKTAEGYRAVVEGGEEREITDQETIEKIEQLLAARREAGKDLSKLLIERGLTTAGINNATLALGAGE